MKEFLLLISSQNSYIKKYFAIHSLSMAMGGKIICPWDKDMFLKDLTIMRESTIVGLTENNNVLILINAYLIRNS